jgi:hypothetical protein
MFKYKQFSYPVMENGIKFNIELGHIVDDYIKGIFKTIDVQRVNLKFYRLCRHKKQKHIYDVFKYCPNLEISYIVHLAHAFEDKQYALVDYFLFNSYRYMGVDGAKYVVEFITNNRRELLKRYYISTNSIETEMALPSMAILANTTTNTKYLNNNKIRFIELTRLLINIGFKPTMTNIFEPTYGYRRNKSESFKTNYKKLVDPMIENVNYMLMWFLLRVLQKQNNPLLDLRKMLYMIMGFLKEPLFDTHEEDGYVVMPAAGINFILISGGCAGLRYST